MYNKVKLSKRQIKEDKFTTFMLNTKQFALENWQFLIIGIAVVVLVIVAIVYMMSSSETRKLEASTRFSRALLDYRNGNSQVAILSFTQILDEFAGDQVAEQSTFLLGKINLDIRNYQEAIQYCQKAMEITLATGEDWTTIVIFDILGEAYFGLRNYESAQDWFQQGLKLAHLISAWDLVTRIMVNSAKVFYSTGDEETAKTVLFAALSHPGMLYEFRALI